MRKVICTFFILLAAVTPAFAKIVSGKISNIDPATKKLTVQTMDAATGKISESEMWINENAVFEAGSLETLKPGDLIWVEAEQDSEGNLKVSKVTKV